MIKIYGNSRCPWCDKAKELAERYEMKYQYLNVDEEANIKELKENFPEVKTIPQIFMDDHHIGGYQEFVQEIENTMGNYGQEGF